MSILSKNSIKSLANSEGLLGNDFVEKNIKGSSYDLRIGTFFLKNEDASENIISVARNNDTIVEVLPSRIITFLTQEVVKLPDNICGTVFPINKKSSTGLLILNPGHIDPGFCGPISICAINLSNETIRLSLSEDIFTIIFTKLDQSTDPYPPIFNNRIEYENNFYKKKASKLSTSLFDLITINKYIPYLRKQITEVLRGYLVKSVVIIVAALGLIATVISIIDYAKSEKVKELNEEIEKQSQIIKNKEDSISIFIQSLEAYESDTTIRR